MAINKSKNTNITSSFKSSRLQHKKARKSSRFPGFFISYTAIHKF